MWIWHYINFYIESVYLMYRNIWYTGFTVLGKFCFEILQNPGNED